MASHRLSRRYDLRCILTIAIVSTLALINESVALLHSAPRTTCYRATGEPILVPLDPSSRSSRRSFLTSISKLGVPAVALVTTFVPATDGGAVWAASASTKESLVSDLKEARAKLEKIPSLIQNMEWDAARSILKTPPVNQLWNLGESQNTLVKLAKETGEFDLLELKDELAISLQMCDQLTYDNAFVYFQPGNGKYKIKEPIDLAVKAMGQIQDAIDIASSGYQ